MLRNRYVLVAGIIALLVLANIASYFYRNWGLITVKVTDVPLSKVIKSIEWQGWVNIYTNLPADTKVTMWVDHVPLAEAMETLAANVGGQPNGAADRQDRPDRPERGNRGGTAGGDGVNRPPGGGPPPDGRPPGGGGGGGGFGRGGFGGGAQWNLAFFVGPTSAKVKEEIRAFEAGTTDDDIRVYSYQTPLQFVASSDDMPAADPRLQAWPGVKPPASAPPAPDPSAAPDGNAAPAADATPAPPPGPPTVQTYLKAFAEASNIWIMTPGSWAPEVATAPPENSSIIRAVKKLVSYSRGSVTQAIVLRVGRGGRGAPDEGGRRGFGSDMEAMADRMRNAINGLPEEARGDALAQLNEEVTFYQNVKAAPADKRPQMIRDHMTDKMLTANNNSRRSPEKRAQRYARMVSNRQAAQGTSTPAKK